MKNLRLLAILFIAVCFVQCSDDDVAIITAETITVDPTAVGIVIGDQTQLNAIVLPTTVESIVAWTSSDVTIASVSATGMVTGVLNGEATITATVDGIIGNCVVTVTEPIPLINEIEFGNGWAAINKTVAIEYMVDPEGTVVKPIYTYEANDILTIDAENGTFTGLKAGSVAVKGSVGDVYALFTLNVYDYMYPDPSYTPYATIEAIKWGELDYTQKSTNSWYNMKLDENLSITKGESVLEFSVNQSDTGKGDKYMADVFVDWNGDGDFDDVNEQLFSQLWVADGIETFSITVNVPTDAVSKSRVRFGLYFEPGNKMVNGFGNADSGHWIDMNYTLK